MEHAAKRRLPVVTVVTSGGARVQEGVLSLMQMAKTVIAAGQLHEKGLPLISVLANPATGHAYASFANLADIILAEPGAIVGLAPMRAIRESSSRPIPGGSHTSDSHLAHGTVDDVVHRSDLRDRIAVLLELLGPRYKLEAQRKPDPPHLPDHQAQAWDSVKLTRRSDRPTVMDYVSRIMSSFVEIHGDRVHGDDGAVVCGLGYLGSQTVVVIGQERGREGDEVERNGGRTSPEGFRKALRAADLAEKFDLPVITLIDTPGPLLSLEAEERGLGNTIASMMSRMASISVPSIAVITGEGGSEGALAVGLANRVLMLENATYSVISPEEAAGLFYQDEARADEAAESLRLTARRLHGARHRRPDRAGAAGRRAREPRRGGQAPQENPAQGAGGATVEEEALVCLGPAQEVPQHGGVQLSPEVIHQPGRQLPPEPGVHGRAANRAPVTSRSRLPRGHPRGGGGGRSRPAARTSPQRSCRESASRVDQ